MSDEYKLELPFYNGSITVNTYDTYIVNYEFEHESISYYLQIKIYHPKFFSERHGLVPLTAIATYIILNSGNRVIHKEEFEIGKTHGIATDWHVTEFLSRHFKQNVIIVIGKT